MNEEQPTWPAAVAMRDGVALAADVALPHPRFRGPALLLRTPYGRRGFARDTRGLTVAAALGAGFAVVAQDVRGRGGSGGAFGFVAQEREDGADALAWAASQPWSDGRIALVGASYPARAQLVGEQRPAAPCALVPAMAGLTSRESWWPGGVLALELAGGWIRDLAARSRFAWEETDAGRAVRALLTAADPVALAQAALDPGHPIRTVLGPILPHLDPCAEPAPSVAAAPRAASLHLTGWADSMLDPTVRAWEAACGAGGGAHHLVVGPWDHRADDRCAAPTLDFLRHHVTGTLGEAPPRVAVFVTGAERWTASESWPPPTVALQPRLTRLGAPSPHAVVLHARADDPVPGLALRAIDGGAGSGAALHALGRRADVAVAVGEPLAEPVVAAGRCGVRLDCALDRAGAAILAKVLDVAPSGAARIVAEGLQRIPAAGAVAVPTTPLHHRWGPGHRIALLLCPSEVPRYLTGVDVDRRIAVAAEGPYLSCLSLPIVERNPRDP